jgi:hypothetical protein
LNGWWGWIEGNCAKCVYHDVHTCRKVTCYFIAIFINDDIVRATLLT